MPRRKRTRKDLTKADWRFINLLMGRDPHHRECTGQPALAFLIAHPDRASTPGEAIRRVPQYMQRREVKDGIEYMRDLLRRKLDKTYEDTLRETATVAFTDIADLLRWDADHGLTLRASADIPPETRKAIRKIKHKQRRYFPREGDPYTESELEVELHPKVTALDLYAKLLKDYGFGPEPPAGGPIGRSPDPMSMQRPSPGINIEQGVVLYLPAPQGEHEWAQQALNPSQASPAPKGNGERAPDRGTLPRYPSTG